MQFWRKTIAVQAEDQSKSIGKERAIGPGRDDIGLTARARRIKRQLGKTLLKLRENAAVWSAG